MQSQRLKTWLFDAFCMVVLNLPPQPKSFSQFLDHLDHLPDTIVMLRYLTVQQKSWEHFDWSIGHLKEVIVVCQC